MCVGGGLDKLSLDNHSSLKIGSLYPISDKEKIDVPLQCL